MFSLDDPAPFGDEPADAVPDRSSRTVLGLVFGAIALLVVLSILTSGGGDEDGDGDAEAPTESTSTTNTRPPSTTRPGEVDTTTTSVPHATDGAVLENSFGHAAVFLSPRGTITALDLATAAEHTWEYGDDRGRIAGLLWSGETLVAQTASGVLVSLRTDGSREWDQVDMSGHTVSRISNGVAHLVPLEPGSGGSSRSIVMVAGRVVGADPARLEVVEMSGHWWGGQSLSGGVLIVGSPDGSWLMAPDGTARRLGEGQIFGARGSVLARARCSSPSECHMIVEDVDSGSVGDLGPLPEPGFVHAAIPSPDGTRVAVFAESGTGSGAELRILHVDGSSPEVVSLGSSTWIDPSRVVWAPDGGGLLWSDESTGVVGSYQVGDDSVEALRLVGALGLGSSNGQNLLLVPLDDLPDGLRPGSGD